MDVTPTLILSMWTAGMAGGAAVVSYWGIVGPGFNWLLAAVVVVAGGATALSGNLAIGMVATVFALVAGITGRSHKLASTCFAFAGLGFLAIAAATGVVPALSGAILLGGMTSEMALGHWFLVDPRLPRAALQRLALAAGIGVGVDVAVMAGWGAFGAGDAVMTGAFAALAVLAALLAAGVWFSLKEPGYSGVMAATGLSYLGVLTAFGVVVVGRLLVAGR